MKGLLLFLVAFWALAGTARAAPEALQTELQVKMQRDDAGHGRPQTKPHTRSPSTASHKAASGLFRRANPEQSPFTSHTNPAFMPSSQRVVLHPGASAAAKDDLSRVRLRGAPPTPNSMSPRVQESSRPIVTDTAVPAKDTGAEAQPAAGATTEAKPRSKLRKQLTMDTKRPSFSGIRPRLPWSSHSDRYDQFMAPVPSMSRVDPAIEKAIKDLDRMQSRGEYEKEDLVKARLRTAFLGIKSAGQDLKNVKLARAELRDLRTVLQTGVKPNHYSGITKASAALGFFGALLGLINMYFSWNSAITVSKGHFQQPPDPPENFRMPMWAKNSNGEVINSFDNKNLAKRSVAESEAPVESSKPRKTLFAREYDTEQVSAHHLQRRGNHIIAVLVGGLLGFIAAPSAYGLFKDKEAELNRHESRFQQVQNLQEQLRYLAKHRPAPQGGGGADPAAGLPGGAPGPETGAAGSTGGLLDATSASSGGAGAGAGAFGGGGGLLSKRSVIENGANSTRTQVDGDPEQKEPAHRLEKRLSFKRMRLLNVMVLATLPVALIPMLRSFHAEREEKLHPTAEQKMKLVGGKVMPIYGSIGAEQRQAGALAGPLPVAGQGGATGGAEGALGGGGALGSSALGGGAQLAKRSTPEEDKADNAEHAVRLEKRQLVKSNNRKLFVIGVLGTVAGLASMLFSYPIEADKTKYNYKDERRQLEAQIKALGGKPDRDFKPPVEQETSTATAPGVANGAAYTGGFGGLLGGMASGGQSSSSTGGGLLDTRAQSQPIAKRHVDPVEADHSTTDTTTTSSGSNAGNRLEKRGYSQYVGGKTAKSMDVAGVAMIFGAFLANALVFYHHHQKGVPFTTPNNNAKGPLPTLAHAVPSANPPAAQQAAPSFGGLLGQAQGAAAGPAGGLGVGTGGGVGLLTDPKLTAMPPSGGGLAKRDLVDERPAPGADDDIKGAKESHRLVKRLSSGFLAAERGAATALPAVERIFATTASTAAKESPLLSKAATTGLAGKEASLLSKSGTTKATFGTEGATFAKGGEGAAPAKTPFAQSNGLNMALTAGGFVPMALPMLSKGSSHASAAAGPLSREASMLGSSGFARNSFSNEGTEFSNGLTANRFGSARDAGLGRAESYSTAAKGTEADGATGAKRDGSFSPSGENPDEKKAANQWTGMAVVGVTSGMGMSLTAS